jgi:hypothetical protein
MIAVGGVSGMVNAHPEFTLIFATRILAPEGEAANTVRYALLKGVRALRADERLLFANA